MYNKPASLIPMYKINALSFLDSRCWWCGSMHLHADRTFSMQLNLVVVFQILGSRFTEFSLGSRLCTYILHLSQLFTFFQMPTFLLFSSFLFLNFSCYLKLLGNGILIISIHLPTPTLCLLLLLFLLFVVAAAFVNPLSVRHHILDS